MSEILLFYWPSILAATITAGALAWIGAFLVTRHAAAQTLAIGQGAGLGVMLGIFFVQEAMHDEHLEHTVWPFLSALLFSIFVFLITERLARKYISKSAFYLAAFAFLWAIMQLLAGALPRMEAHSSALFFGDIVTIQNSEAFFFSAISCLALVFLIFSWRKHSERAFLVAILDESPSLARDAGFYFLSTAMVCLSVQFLGILFTIAALFFPTILLAQSKRTGVLRHLCLSSFLASLATVTGFLASLTWPRLHSTPSIAILLAFFPLCFLFFERIFFRCK
jgi:ABC-type Mn2+/Zn2+ transport system permease subunit